MTSAQQTRPTLSHFVGAAWEGDGSYLSLQPLLAKRPDDVLLPPSRLHFLTGAILDLSAEAGEGPFGQVSIM